MSWRAILPPARCRLLLGDSQINAACRAFVSDANFKSTGGIYDILEGRGVEIVDATCPFVKKIHRIVSEHSGAGDAVVIIGSPEHPEVEGIRGWGNEYTTVVKDGAGVDNYVLPQGKKLCIVSQTTFNYNKFKELVEKFLKKGYDSRCV